MGEHKLPKDQTEFLPKDEYRKRRGNTGTGYANRIRGINVCLGCGKLGGTLVVLFKNPKTRETRYTHKDCYDLSRAALMCQPKEQPKEEVKQGASVGATLSTS